MTTPLYKRMKDDGSSFYVFPGAAEDISAAYQNENYKMYFSKFALLNIPKQITNIGINDLDSTVNPEKLDFNNSSFYRLSPSNATNLADQMVESLRNYVANQEVTIRESKQGKDYFYDPNLLNTTTEKIFFKWCKKLNIIDFEPALDKDEYYADLDEFKSLKNDINYHSEKLWKEREVIDYQLVKMSQYDFTNGNVSANVNFLDLTFQTTTNFKIGDYISFYFTDTDNISPDLAFLYRGVNFAQEDLGYRHYKVVQTRIDTLTNNQIVTIDLNVFLAVPNNSNGYDPLAFNSGGTIVQSDFGTDIYLRLIYTRLINYIGDISATSNVQEGNRAYTQVYANIASHCGKSPDILFRTRFDNNYEPNLEYPFSPSQYQPEIIGAENFNNPIVLNPENYPGDQYGSFDDPNYFYSNSNGDQLRRTGDYFGVFGTSDNPSNTSYDSSKLDGIGLDFDTDHYVKMNIIGQEVSNFTDFSTLAINNTAPQDFEFNAILWYYTVENNKGETSDNLYGVTFLQNPKQNTGREEGFELKGIKFPTYKKLVNDGTKDGTSFSFSLNLNYNLSNDQIQPIYSPTPINGMLSFELFNDAMIQLSATNSNFNRIISENADLRLKVREIEGLIYTQTDLELINRKIQDLEELLKLYSTNQLISSDTIRVNIDTTARPPMFSLDSIDSRFKQINNVLTSDMYSTGSIVPYHISIPDSKDFLVRIHNNDTTQVTLQDNLMIILDKELDFKQTCIIEVTGSELSTENKKLDIILNAKLLVSKNVALNVPLVQETPFILNLNLPVYYNLESSTQNTASRFGKNVDLTVNMLESITVNDDKLLFTFDSYLNGYSKGDSIVLNNFILSGVDYSDQYIIDSVDIINKTMLVKYTSNKALTEYISTNSLIFLDNNIESAITVSLNKGYTITIIKVSDKDYLDLKDRYFVKIDTK